MTLEMPTADRVTFGLGLPQAAFDGVDAPALLQLAQSAEGGGFSALWTSEIIRAPMLAPLVTLSFIAAVTQRIAIGTGVLLLPLRVPAQLAMELASLDILSQGRVIVGLGLGRGDESLYASYGIDTADRLHRYVGALRIIRDLLESGLVDYGGPEWILDEGFGAVPKTVRRPRPPLWLAAHEERPLRRAVEFADGWIASGSAPASEFGWAVGILRDEMERRNRDPSSFTIATRIYTALDATPADRERVSAWFGRVYGRRSLADSAVHYGSSEALNEIIATRVAAGARHVILNPVLDHAAQLGEFVSNVVPAEKTDPAGRTET